MSKRSATEFLFGVAVCALLLQTLETFRLAREIFWFGTPTTGEGTFALGFLIYAVLVTIASAIPAAFLVILGRRAETIPLSVPVYIVTALLAVVLVRNTELGFSRPELLFVIVVVAIGLFGGYGALRFDAAWQRAAAGTATLGLLAAVAAVHEIKYATTLFKLEPNVTVYLATATGIFVHIYAWRAWTRTRDRGVRWATTARVIAAVLIVPFTARAFADYRGILSAEDGPRVLLLTADTLRADYLSLYDGNVATPNLNRLGEQGVTFENAYALSSWTPPSLAGMFSSQYPPSTSADADLDQWREDFTTGFISLAGYWTSAQGRSFIGDLRGSGIRTAMVLANTVMMGHQWLVDDFEFTYSVNHQTEGQRDGLFRHLPLLHRRIEAIAPGLAPYREFDSSAPTRDLARIHLRQLRHESFFLWVHFLDPHSPYAPPEKYIPSDIEERMYPPGGAIGGAMGADSNPNRTPATGLYAAEVRYLDDCVGDILDQLKNTRLDNSTLVCFTSDHGEEFWEHGTWGHGQSLYEELVRVPLIFNGPGIAQRRIASPVSAIHVIPTLAGWMGESKRTHWRGNDLSPMLQDPAAPAPEVPVFTGATINFHGTSEPLESVVVGRHKLIRGIRTGKIRLYDLEHDPGEKKNIAAEDPGKVAEYTALLDRWNETFPSRMGDDWTRQPSDVVDDSGMLEAFEALGYL